MNQISTKSVREHKVQHPIATPVWRLLRAYAFDPSLSTQLDTADINEITIKVKWEDNLKPGPIGDYIEVVDVDPASQRFYEPVDLNDPYVLAMNGLSPSEGNPQFHQQMVYAVAMTTIRHFERALGRFVFWAPRVSQDEESEKDGAAATAEGAQKPHSDYVQRLRLYPHALREQNAYYTYMKKALLFGYFPSVPLDISNQPANGLPGGLVFTCLSHDIIAHETTHALLDGLHPRYMEPTHPDSLAFHEAFADIVALFQHFSYPEVLKNQIAKTRGELDKQNQLGDLAQQFGAAIGQYGALRSAIGKYTNGVWEPLKPDPQLYRTAMEPHDRGALLVAAIFDGFLSIYKQRISDLLRIASGGTGVLPAGELHPDLVNRLADEASKAAQHVLAMCIRALDYCPPLDINFGDYLRALITADTVVVPDDDRGYRLALIEGFRRRGIYPTDIKTLSIESVSLPEISAPSEEAAKKKKKSAESEQDRTYPVYSLRWFLEHSTLNEAHKAELYRVIWLPQREARDETYQQAKKTRYLVHDLIEFLNDEATEKFEQLTGLVLRQKPERDDLGLKANPLRQTLSDKYRCGKNYTFEVHSARRARRATPDGEIKNQTIITILQNRLVAADPNSDAAGQMIFRGGCTLIFKLVDLLPISFVISKPVDDPLRLERQRDFQADDAARSLRATYFGSDEEPFASLHRLMFEEVNP